MNSDGGNEFDGSVAGAANGGGGHGGFAGASGGAGRDASAGTAGVAGRGGFAGSGGQDSGAAGVAGAGGLDAGLGGVGGAAGSVDAAADAPCVPTQPPTEVCDGVDNDCDGQTDDVDVGQDGISDCLRIVLIGDTGTRTSDDLLAWMQTNSVSVVRIHDTAASAPTLTSADLSGIDIVVLDNLQRAYAPSESDDLLAWVQNGGGMFSMNGHVLTPGHVDWGNSILLSFGIEHMAGFVSGPITDFASHPLTAGLTSIPFRGGYRLAPTMDAAPAFTSVATLSGEPVGVVQEIGAGRIYLWGDDWVQFDDRWQALPEIMQFWVNTFSWLTHAN